MNAPASAHAGSLLFARYAYPPNELGYCGPDDHRALLEYGASGSADRGLVELARRFTGPWPYLTLLAGAAGVEDPFDTRVVEAYWVGNELLDRVAVTDLGNRLEDSFKPLAGPSWRHLAEAIPAGATPHHNFHVLSVYPWTGLLTSGRIDEPLHVLDRCRIRWGRVVEVAGEHVEVRFRPLAWDGKELSLGPPVTERATRAVDGLGFVEQLRPGDRVSLHWGWVCDRLSADQLQSLRSVTSRLIAMTNHRLSHSGPAAALS